jgi:hypothetical protein
MMMAGASGATSTAAQIGNPALGTVSRKPQTTATQADTSVPFVRISRRAKITGYSTSGVAFGAQVNQPLKAAGGYLRGFRIKVTSQSFTSTAATVAAADAPWNLFSSIFLRDPLGQPIYQTDGYGLYLINLYSGQCGNGGTQNPANLPSFSALQTTSGAGSGGFAWTMFLPLEFDSAAYCCLASMNASSQPTLTINVNTSGNVYTTAPTTLGTFTITVTEEFWATPISAPNLAPPQVGSSAQWSAATAAQSIGSGAFVRVTWPRVGTWIHTLIMVLRDSTGARIAAFPTGDLTLYVDGVPLLSSEQLTDHQDDIYRWFVVTPPTGVLVASWRNSVQESVDSSDTHDVLLPTTPATLLEVAGTWGTVSNAPAQLTCLTGELYPVGGIPYTHLAQ